MWISETLAASPLAIRCAGSIRTGGSPGQVSMSGLMGVYRSHIRRFRRIVVKARDPGFRNPILPRPLDGGCRPVQLRFQLRAPKGAYTFIRATPASVAQKR